MASPVSSFTGPVWAVVGGTVIKLYPADFLYRHEAKRRQLCRVLLFAIRQAVWQNKVYLFLGESATSVIVFAS